MQSERRHHLDILRGHLLMLMLNANSLGKSSNIGVFDLDRVNAVFRAELSDYVEGMPEYGLSAETENRGFLIAWLSVLTPEALDEQSQSELWRTYSRLESGPQQGSGPVVPTAAFKNCALWYQPRKGLPWHPHCQPQLRRVWVAMVHHGFLGPGRTRARSD